jgi:hypothetical protein
MPDLLTTPLNNALNSVNNAVAATTNAINNALAQITAQNLGTATIKVGFSSAGWTVHFLQRPACRSHDR